MRRSSLRRALVTHVIAVLLALSPQAIHAETFGTGANVFSIDFVQIGDPGNAADTTGMPNPSGAVSYVYNIAKYEISEDMIAKANTIAGLGITTTGFAADKPATSVSWIEAAKFVNWLNTSQGYAPAYNFDINDEQQLWSSAEAWQFGGENLYRHKDSRYWLPSNDEWYKAAYFEPVSDVYFDYPTGSDTQPTPVAEGLAQGTAVFANQQSFADINMAGGVSPFGTMAQGGNADEWLETSHNLTNDNPNNLRGVRGGHIKNFASGLDAFDGWPSTGASPTGEGIFVGFRVAALAGPIFGAGDFNGDGTVDLGDYALWRDNFGAATEGPINNNGNGVAGVDSGDYNVWKQNYGTVVSATLISPQSPVAVPEPEAGVLMLLLLAAYAWGTLPHRAH